MTGLQSQVGAFCTQRGFRTLGADEPVAQILERMKRDDPASYKIWWEVNSWATWDYILNDSEERDDAAMRGIGVEPPIRRSQRKVAA